MRKRDQTPDACGLAIKRDLLERLVRDDPEPAAFEAWLARHAEHAPAPTAGAVWAMARAVHDEWRLAHAMPQFADWLASGAPSEDANATGAGAGRRGETPAARAKPAMLYSGPDRPDVAGDECPAQ